MESAIGLKSQQTTKDVIIYQKKKKCLFFKLLKFDHVLNLYVTDRDFFG